MAEAIISIDDINGLDKWGFDCPLCDHWNETEEDPDRVASVFCENCKTDIKIEHD